jgi:long-chain fatty acid transport protein
VATDGFAKLKGDSWALGYNAGLLFQPAAGTRLGLHYRSKIKHRVDAEATIANFTGAMAALNGTFNAKTELNLPAIVSLGIAHELTPAWTLLAQAQWFGWSDFNEIRVRINGLPDNVRPQNFRDAHSLSFGAEYKASSAWTLRGGMRIDKTPTVDAFRNSSIPDTDVNWYGLGATYRASEHWSLDLGLLHAQYKKSGINLNAALYTGTGLDSTVNTRGQINNKVNVVSAALRYQF